MTILYTVGDKLYINLTNKCPCSCTFCIRQNGDGAYGSDSLWLDREPTVDEVLSELEKYDLTQFREIVFCGYGEPMERAEDVGYIGRYIRDNFSVPVRLNTNGLGDKIWGEPTAKVLEGAVDIVSVSLNQCGHPTKMGRRFRGDDLFCGGLQKIRSQGDIYCGGCYSHGGHKPMQGACYVPGDRA